MTLKSDLISYRTRWAEVEAFQNAERRQASLALRWQQLNAAVGLAKSLGWLTPEPTEMEVFERWARLKNKMLAQRPKA